MSRTITYTTNPPEGKQLIGYSSVPNSESAEFVIGSPYTTKFIENITLYEVYGELTDKEIYERDVGILTDLINKIFGTTGKHTLMELDVIINGVSSVTEDMSEINKFYVCWNAIATGLCARAGLTGRKTIKELITLAEGLK